MPLTTSDSFSLLGCITFVYVAVRLTIKIIYRLTCSGIRKIEDRKQNDNYADDPTNFED